jgi:hypothetical protein
MARALATCPGLDAHLVLVTREVCGGTVRHVTRCLQHCLICFRVMPYGKFVLVYIAQ